MEETIMKKIFAIAVSIVVSFITTVLYHIGVKSFGTMEASVAVLITRGISDLLFFAVVTMLTCAVYLTTQKRMKGNYVLIALTNVTTLGLIFLAEQITEQTIISEIEIEIEYKFLIGIFIITCMIEIGSAVIDEKVLLEDVDITEDMKYLCRKL